MKRLKARKSLSDRVAQAVAEEIANGRLKLGQMLSETMVAHELGVSRTPVREAFSHLEFRGLLITKPQSGTYVFDVGEAEMKDLFEVSSCMEMQGLHSAIQRNNGGLTKQVSDISEEMIDAFESNDQNRYTVLDRRFHKTFVTFSGNGLLSDMYEPVSLKIQALAQAGIIREPLDQRYHDSHIDIAVELARSGLDAVRSIFSRHLEEAVGFQPTGTLPDR